MDLKNKNILVYGVGASGISAYNFLIQKGANVYLYDDEKTENLTQYKTIKKFSEVETLNLNYAVISPGVQIIGNKNIKKLTDLGVLLISELELGYLHTKGLFIAVTGTNGKTTCVHLLNHILSSKYNKVFMCGNMGVPITSICSKTTEDSIIICEVSSFMLELTSQNFAPDIAIITNITPDHISRHKTFENYHKTKLNITQNQTQNQYIIVNEELKDIQTKANVLVVPKKNKFKSKLIGNFNQQNISQCKVVCSLLSVTNKEFKKHLLTFNPVKFRLQKIGKIKGITYINDSKSTNTDSTVKAVNAIKKPCILLLGGSDKDNDFYDIFKLKNKIKLAVIYGETANKLEQDALFCGFTKIVKFANLSDALYNLNKYIKRGDTVLFSPACASYDEFLNYIERGEFFNKFTMEQ